MNEHDAYHSTEDTLRIKGHGVHGEHTTRYPVEKEPAHSFTCVECGGHVKDPHDECCDICRARCEYTAPAPAPKVTDDDRLDYRSLWLGVIGECFEAGMIISSDKDRGENVSEFIRSLAQRAGEERYTVGQIENWLNQLNEKYDELGTAIDLINNPQDGIAAVTTRADTRPDRGGEE